MENILENEVKLENNLVNEKDQNNFLETTLGKTINTGIDIGIRALLPDYIEEQIIDLKDNLMRYGLKDGIKKSIDDAIKSGGIIDNISYLLDDVINKVKNAGLINSTIANTIKKGKNSILNNVEKNIENNFNNQIKSLNYTEKYINNWKEFYKNKDFNGMEIEYNKIEKEIKNLAPIEKIIDNVKTIENLHTLIKNNGQNFNLTKEEIELAEKLK